MRRTRRPTRLFAYVLAGFALALAPGFVRAFAPIISVPPQTERIPRDAQPLAGFRCPAPFLPAKRVVADDGFSTLKVFLSDRSPLDEEPTRMPALAVSIPKGLNATPPSPKPASGPPQPDAATRAAVMNAVKILNDPENFSAAPPFAKPLSEPPATDPATRAAIANALHTLRGPVEMPALPRVVDAPKPEAPSVRDAKLSAVADSIAALNASLSASTLEEMPALVVASISPAPGLAEEQEAKRSAIVKVSAQQLIPPEQPSMLPPMIPAVEMPAPSAVSPSCLTCGRILGHPLQRIHQARDAIGGCSTCGGGCRCAPGHEPCEPCEAHDGPLGRLFCDFYQCLCCPDPCYEPRWRQLPNAALFVDGARPVTQTEVRWNSGNGGVFPDRSEYIWARADGRGRGPMPPKTGLAENHFDFNELVFITETAKDNLSAIVGMPYRSVSPEILPHGAGFGDMWIGTKTLLLDCELLQVSLQFLTYMPVGNSLKGVGNGHVSLEPSVLFALKLTCDTYIQGQFSEWIPIAGDPAYMGSIFHTHFSANHVIHRFGPDIPIVGTMELNTFSFQDGNYTHPVLGAYQKSSDTTYVSLGPGIRLFFCDKLDIGFGSAIAATGDHFAREYYRTSVRFRF
jgi:hypothetical protein